ncbi:MAG TPA: cupredoxin domain-containing protein [Candidatus Thermoplasmatota archaeon]|nr:cupredoxin domain-containing protein [Candidatus Thermoplasmatota archaeon]
MKLLQVLLVLSIAAGVAGCARPDATPTTPTSTNTTGSEPLRPAVAVALSLIDQTPGVGVPPTTMGIEPATVELALHVPVNLTITNDGNGPHNLIIEGLDVATDTIASGESVSVEFTPHEEGTFRMYCSLGVGPVSHDLQGMHGEVTVA